MIFVVHASRSLKGNDELTVVDDDQMNHTHGDHTSPHLPDALQGSSEFKGNVFDFCIVPCQRKKLVKTRRRHSDKIIDIP